jgi:hypothetical protein
MKSLELNKYGVQEMNAGEMMEVKGGNLLDFFAWGSCNCCVNTIYP